MPEVPIMRSYHTRARNIVNKTFEIRHVLSQSDWQLIFLLLQSRDDTYNDIVIDNGLRF